MKNFLLFLLGLLISALYFYVLFPIYIIGIMSWFWLPIMFDLNNCFGGAELGLVLGIVITIATSVVKNKLVSKLESY